MNAALLGRFELCLNVADINTSIAFYTKLGFEVILDKRELGFATMFNGDVRISVFQRHIARNLLNFRGANVFDVARVLKERGLTLFQDAHIEIDGSAAAELLDPDGNVIYLNTSQGETTKTP